MTQRRRIAIAYSFGVPILFAFLMFEVGELYGLVAHERELVRGATVLSESDRLRSALRDAEASAQGYAVSGSGYYSSSYADAASRLNGSLAKLDEVSKSDPAMQSKLQPLHDLTAKQLSVLQHEMDSRKLPRPAGTNSAPDARDATLGAEIEKIVAGIGADQQSRLEQEQVSATRSASAVDTLAKYGGVVTIWIVGVAALLLFYDDSERIRERIDQRLHNDILESLPLAVCLTTETGAILYVNPAAEAAFGYKPGELVARNIEVLCDPSGRGAEPDLIETLAKLAPHELWSGELRTRTKDSHTIQAASWIASIRIGERDCRLLVHSAPAAGGPEQHNLLAAGFRPQSEEARGTAALLPPTAPDGPERTTPPDSEAVVVSHRTK